MKHRDKILITLMEKSPMLRRELVEKTQIDTASVGHYLKKLAKENIVERISHGEYGITANGRIKGESLRKKYSSMPIRTPEHQEEKNSLDLEDMDTIINLKQKYGREKLQSILEKIKKVIE